MDEWRDRCAIDELLLRYAYYLDSGRRSRIADEIFTPDARLDYGGEPILGKAKIDAFFLKFPDSIACSHIVTNVMIEVDGDVAKSFCRAMAWYWSDFSVESTSLDPSDLLVIGGYQDALVRTHKGWRIAHRTCVQFGTGVGIGMPPPHTASILRALRGKAPTWPE